jgi:hypothetical protein
MPYEDKMLALVLDGHSFRDGQAYGYQTAGGTFIIGSTYIANDDGKDHDLFAVTPWYDIVKLSPLAYVDSFQEALQQALWERNQEKEPETPPTEAEGVPWYDQPD